MHTNQDQNWHYCCSHPSSSVMKVRAYIAAFGREAAVDDFDGFSVAAQVLIVHPLPEYVAKSRPLESEERGTLPLGGSAAAQSAKEAPA